MILRGMISAVDNNLRKARVMIEDFDGCVTPELPIAISTGNVFVNDMVIVVFFSDDPLDGLIIARV